VNDVTTDESYLSRLFSRVYAMPVWLRIAAALLLLGIPFLLAFAFGDLAIFLQGNAWRVTLVEPVVIIYIFLIAPVFRVNELRLVRELRPVVQVEDARYAEIVTRSTHGDDRIEFGALLVGIGFGYLVDGPQNWGPELPWPLGVYLLITAMAMYGLLAWVIVASISSSRLVTNLLREPLAVDIFDIRPFEPIGRQSLMLSLSFIVGITISLLFLTSREAMTSPWNLVFYGVLLLVAVLLFFLNMRPTHGVLASVKAEETAGAEVQISRLYRQLRDQAGDRAAAEAEAAASATALELNAWLAMEARLKATRSWPYNTEMLRALTVSVLTPIAIGLARFAAAMLQN
jgi:hypothetical protein